MKNTILTILICGVLILGIVGCIKERHTYKINLQSLDNITSVEVDTLAQSNNLKTFNDGEIIERLYNVFNNKTTDMESINYNPKNPEELFVVTFKDNDNKSTSLYIYTKENKYYIEQAYNGIYEITKDEYNIVKDCTNEIYSKIDNLNLKSDTASTTQLVRFNNILYGKSFKIIDYVCNSESVGIINILIDSEYVPKNNNETNTLEILNALVYDPNETSLVLRYNNEFVLFEKIEE